MTDILCIPICILDSVCQYLQKKTSLDGILLEIALNLEISVGRIDNFKISSLQTDEHNIAFIYLGPL